MRHFFVCCLWAASTLMLYGQTGQHTAQGDFVGSLNHLFEHVDLSEASTGYLLDRSLQLNDVGLYDGVAINPNNITNVDVLGGVYATLAGAAFDPVVPLPAPDDYMAAAAATNSESEIIPITFLAWKYNGLKPDAVGLSLISIQNGQLFDVPGRPQSPYWGKTAFIATLMGNSTKKNTLRFSFPTNLQYTNVGATFQSFTVDVGNGPQTAFPGDLLAVQFPNSGVYDVLITATMSNGTVFQGHTRLEVLSSSGNKFGINPVTLPIPPTNGHSGMTVNIFYNTADCEEPPVCSDPNIPCRLLRPLIIIDGYDEDNDRDFSDVVKRIQVIPFPTGEETLEDFIESGGYDLIFLDYNDGGDDINRNGLAVRDAIKQINEWKNGNGSFEKNIIIGASMGGLTGKYALLKMEEENYDYQTSKFFNLDGPMYGSNFPLGIQYALNHVVNLEVPSWLTGNLTLFKLKELVPDMADLENVLNSEAARQQMIYNVQEDNLNDFTDDAHTDFMEVFHHLGRTSNGKLYDCDYIALCNGAINGIGQQHEDDVTVTPGAKIFSLHSNGGQFLAGLETFSGFWGNVLGGIASFALNTKTQIDMEAWTVPDNPATFQGVYIGDIYLKVLGIPILNSSVAVGVRNTRPLDTAPGGTATFADLSELIAENPGMEDIISIFTPALCFVPMVSALDIFPPADQLNGNFTNIQGIVGAGLTATDRYIGSTDDDNLATGYPYGQYNTGHAWIHDNISRYLLSEILGNEEINAPDLLTLNNRTYNFGDAQVPYTDSGEDLGDFLLTKTGNTIKHDLTIEGAGKIWVNRNDRIAFTDVQSNVANATSGVFHVYLSGGGCSATTTAIVTVKDGGEINIGEWNAPISNKGILHVNKNARLNINRAGTVLVNDNATLFVEGGGIATVDGGLLHVNWSNGKIIVQSGGVLQIKATGKLRVSNGAQVIVEAGGKLILDGGADTQLWGDPAAEDGESTIHIKSGGELVINGDINFSGNGFFQFEGGNILTLNAPAFKLAGSGKEVRMMQFNSGYLSATSGKTFQFSDGQIVKSNLNIYDGGKIILSNIHCTGPAGQAGGAAVTANNPGFVNINNVKFTGLQPALSFENVQPNKAVMVSNSLIENHQDLGIYAQSCHHLQFSNVSILGNGQTGDGIDLFEVEHVSLSNCHIMAENKGIYAVNSRTLVMSGGIIEGCESGITDGEDESSSNILMFQGATIQDCEIGIHLDGTSSTGSVLMDCAQLIDNTIGIEGTDITLMIDAEENRQCLADPLAPNTFTMGLDDVRLFDICNDLKQFTSINAKGNFWFPQLPGSFGPVPGTYFIKKSPAAGSSPPCRDVVALVTTNAVQDQPQNCPVPSTPCDEQAPPPTELCEIQLQEGLLKAHDNFHKGIEAIKEQEFDLGDSLLTPVSNIHDATIFSTLGGTCKDFINMSFAIIDDGSSNAKGNNAYARAKIDAVATETSLIIIPNPASEKIEIRLPAKTVEISIFDHLGRLKFNQVANGTVVISVKDFENGIYWLSLKMKDDAFPINKKLIIQH